MASGDPSDLDTISQNEFEQSFKKYVSNISTSQPPNGGPWVDNVVLAVAFSENDDGCE
ncbi:MAG: hypothetical protein ACRCVY_05935 [Commensalibacter sp.]